MIDPNNRTTLPPAAYVLIAVLLWSTGGLFIKLTTLDAYQVTFFRSLLAGITVAVLTRKQGLKIDAFGVLTSIIYAALLFLFVWATKHTTAANAIFLQYTAPIYILILAPFVIGEKFHWRDLVTVIFCIGGMSLFFVGKLEITDYQGNIAALFSGVFLGLYIMLLKHPAAVGRKQKAEGSATGAQASLPASAAGGHETRDRRQESEPGPVATGDLSVPPAVAGGFSSEPGAVAAGVSEAGTTKPHEATRKENNTNYPQSAIRNPQSMNPAIAVIYGNFLLAILTLPSGIAAVPVMNLTDIGSVAFLGIVQIGIAYVLFIRGVTGGTRPLDASIIGFIEPLLNPVWVFLFVGERPSTWAVVGGVMIIATVVTHTIVQYRGKNLVAE